MADNNPILQKTFFYHADANPIGGIITRPFSGFVPSNTSVSLPLVGGFIEKQAVGCKWNNIVSYTRESTHVSGSKKDAATGGPWTTQVSSTIEGLNILEVVTADKVVAQLSVAHPYEGGDPTISIMGSQFINLRISGIPIELILLYDLFTDHDGLYGEDGVTPEEDNKKHYPRQPWLKQKKFMGKVEKQLANAREAFKANGGNAALPDHHRHHFQWFHSDQKPDDRDYIVCSIIDPMPPISDNFPGFIAGNGIYIPGFGTVFFGELIVSQGVFRLSMIRAELGSPVAGSISAATASSNGKTNPPGGG